MVLLATSIGYLGSNYFYWKAGRKYKALMEEKDRLALECELDPEMMEAEVLTKIR